jgi:hypothetical protein
MGRAITKLSGLGLVSLLALVVPAAVQAGPITVDGGWYGFCFNTPGPATAGCDNDAGQSSGNDFTFSATDPVLLKVTDAFLHGDTFDVFDFGVLLFSTPSVAMGGGATTNPDLAFADPLYSHDSIVLGAGPHSISIFNVVGPISGGGAYMEVETAVPEPGTLALLGTGVLALVRRRRQLRS